MMTGVTIRLGTRSLHVVRELRDCDTCTNHAAHVRTDAGPFVQAEINRAVQGDEFAFAEFRELAARYGFLHDVHRVIDPKVLDHVAWLFETNRLLVVECVLLHDERAGVAAPAPPKDVAPQRRAVPVADLKTPVEDLTKTWVAIELLDDNGKPVANQKYRVTVPGGVIKEGTLDAEGRARIPDLDEGNCEISFPDLDAREWKPA